MDPTFMLIVLSVACGAVVGLSLGLTGGGGAIFAVPLLVHVLNVPAKEAVATSLTAVGTISLFGFLNHWRRGLVEVRTGLLFATAGVFGAPVGTWLAIQIPEPILLLLFAGLMVIVALRLWRQRKLDPIVPPTDLEDSSICRRDSRGELRLNSRCTALLLGVGLLTGVLAGMFGVGGGFVIVPALVLLSGMSIHRAVGTSLMVIMLVSAAGLGSHWFDGRTVPLAITFWFILGGAAGLLIGLRLGHRLPEARLRRTFAIAILAVALFVTIRSLSP